MLQFFHMNSVFTSEVKKAMKEIYEFLAKSDRPQKADAIFLATGSSLKQPKKGAELFKKGFSKYIFIVGKKGTFSSSEWQEDEAIKYKEYLLKYGVPENAIFAKPIATNSHEEVEKVVPWMKEVGINPKKIIIVDTPKHQMREWATFTKYAPGIEYINIPTDEKLVFDQDTLDRLAAEMDRLINYPKDGIISEVKIPTIIIEAYEKIKPFVKNHYKRFVPVVQKGS